MCTGKIRLLSQLGAEKIAFPCFYIFVSYSLTDRQNIYRIDAYIREECAEKKFNSISIRSQEKRFSIFLHF